MLNIRWLGVREDEPHYDGRENEELIRIFAASIRTAEKNVE